MKLEILNEEVQNIYSGELCLRSRSAVAMLEDEEEILEEIFGEFAEETDAE